ncbi:MAG: IS3 family transposase [Saprospiraceae bacterium]|nr:IS3 family transposase [Saprospiraceae bacterium]
MKALYEMAGTTKQAHWVGMRRTEEQQDRFTLLEACLAQERGLHPAMSLKKIYHKLQPDFVGRDAFVQYGMSHGYEPFSRLKFHKTTDPGPSNAALNLLHRAMLFDINQVWVSDIFYFKVAGQFCYVVLIEDLYSRKIVGYHAAQRMFAQANLDALSLALAQRGIEHYAQKLIHHSDKGSQYRSGDYTQQLQKVGIRISMGNSCYDNAFMESTNGIIKNEYLRHRPINTFDDLQQHLQHDVQLYNTERPHGSLHYKTPDEFERYIFNIPLHQRTPLSIYTDQSKRHNLLNLTPDNHQLKFQFPHF